MMKKSNNQLFKTIKSLI